MQTIIASKSAMTLFLPVFKFRKEAIFGFTSNLRKTTTFPNLSEFIGRKTSPDNLEIQFFRLTCVRLPFSFPKNPKKLGFEEN